MKDTAVLREYGTPSTRTRSQNLRPSDYYFGHLPVTFDLKETQSRLGHLAGSMVKKTHWRAYC